MTPAGQTPNPVRVHEKISGRSNRARFLRRLSMGVLAAAAATLRAAPSTEAANEKLHDRKNRLVSKVKRWDVITIGNLSRNRYWGESDAKGVRSAICTCTVLQGEGFRWIVDPSLSDPSAMASELDRRTGLKPGDLTVAFVTHEHSDHWFGLAHFPQARWLAAPQVAAALNSSGKLPKLVESVSGDATVETLEILPTPGHTLSHHSLRFACDNRWIVIAGDAVPTRDFWLERRGYYNCVDFAASEKTMNKIAGLADLVVPGHDNYFMNAR